jgi:tetratricopeptide (TPR) repeat protein/ABC-type lipoprotein export system ATPase subunit
MQEPPTAAQTEAIKPVQQKPQPQAEPKVPQEEIKPVAAETTEIIGQSLTEIKLDEIEEAEETSYEIDTIIEDEEIEDQIEEITGESFDEEFPDTIKEDDSSINELVRFAVMSVEIVNFFSLAESLDKNTLESVKNKVWGITKKAAINASEDFLEISNNIGFISFAHAENNQQSSIFAVQVAAEIFKMVSVLNQQFEATLHNIVKIKIGIAFNDTEGVSKIERSIASGWSIVVSEEIKKHTEGICSYDTIGPLPIGNQMVTFYKLRVEDSVTTGDNFDYDQPGQREETESTQMRQQPSKYTEETGAPPKVEDKEPIPEVATKTLHKDAIVNNLINACHLADSAGKGELISVIGEDGSGKSTVIRQLKASLPQQSFTWMSVRCNFLEQQMPLAALKDMLRNMFNIPNIIYNKEEAQNVIKEAVESILGPNDQLCYIINSLVIGDEISGLTKNHIVNALITIIKGLAEKSPIIFTIEDLDTIDNTSFEVIETLLEAGILDSKVVMIATYHPNLNFVESKPHLVRILKYSQMALKPLTEENIDEVIRNTIQADIILPDNLKQQLINNTNCVPFAIETAFYLMYELGVIMNTENGFVFNEEATQWELPPNIQEILRHRLHKLSQDNPNAFMILQMASALGPKFTTAMFQDLTQGTKQIEEIVQLLNSLGFLLFEDQNTIVFKHHTIWEIVYYVSIPNESRPQFHMQVLNYLEKVQQSGGRMDLAFLAYQSEMAGKRRRSLNYWNLVANQILALGLNTGYSEVMMRYINLLEESDIPNKADLQLNALEGIAKVVHLTDPELAVQAFRKVLPVREQEGNTPRLLELRGFLSLSLEQLGHWDESIAETQKSLDLLNPQTVPLERAMLLCSQLSPMENMGKIGWIMTNCKDNIFPALEKALKEKSIPEGITEEQLFKTLCNAKISFANALITIGHHESFNIFNDLLPEIQRRGLQDIGLKIYLLNAKAHALRGEIQPAEQILTQTREYLTQMPGINLFSLMWGEAAIYLNLENANWENLTNLIEGARIQAKKLNHYPIIALTKAVRGILYQVQGNYKESLEAFNDLINYASQYKISTYALMGWYYLAVSEMQAKNYDKAENITQRALEIARMPDIYNLYSIVTLNRLLGEIYIRKGDIESSGAPLEDGWKIATELQNHAQVAKVASTIGQMYQELMAHTDQNQKEYADKAYEFMSNALNIFNQLGNQHHAKLVEKAIENLKVVCKVNSIELSTG